MNYRTKLLFFSLALVILTCALVLSVAYLGERRVLVEQIQRHVKSIAADAAARVNVDLHEQIRNPGDEDGEAYKEVEKELRRVRNRYRQLEYDVAYIYTVRPADGGSGSWIYVVDAEERGNGKSMVGDPVVYEADNPLDELRELKPYAYADHDFTHDQYGSWFSGNAPIKNAEGKVVAMVGIDIRADDVVARTNQILRQSVMVGGLAVLIGIMGSVWISRWATRPLSEIATALARIGKGRLDERVRVTRNDEFAELGEAVNTMARSLEQQLALKHALSRHVSREFSRQIISKRDLVILDGVEQDVTILFCDIRNFEQLGEVMDSDVIIAFLNEYFTVLVDAVFGNGGTLDKFNGDGFMATFGGRNQQADAVRAAVRIHREHMRLAMEWDDEGEMPVRLGIGIHTGRAMVGDASEAGGMAYSAAGEAVEMAARVESFNRRLGTACLVSGATQRAVAGLFDFVGVNDITVPSEEGPMTLFTIRGMMECDLVVDAEMTLTV